MQFSLSREPCKSSFPSLATHAGIDIDHCPGASSMFVNVDVLREFVLQELQIFGGMGNATNSDNFGLPAATRGFANAPTFPHDHAILEVPLTIISQCISECP